jgi:hypothetical protein
MFLMGRNLRQNLKKILDDLFDKHLDNIDGEYIAFIY